jgi:phosphoenolpyruvate---glycerone phosphotransferase subunit DhaL
MRRFADVVVANKEQLTELDAAIGDADHGINMDRGMAAVAAALADGGPPTPGELLKLVGMTLVRTVGGASGPLYGTFFLRMAAAVGDGEQVEAMELAKAFRAGLEGVVERGKAEPGDKTMFDALSPAVDALESALARGATLRSALQTGAAAAANGRDATTAMLALKGRASYLGERSVGHQDPGATSAALLVASAATTLVNGR